MLLKGTVAYIMLSVVNGYNGVYVLLTVFKGDRGEFVLLSVLRGQWHMYSIIECS